MTTNLVWLVLAACAQTAARPTEPLGQGQGYKTVEGRSLRLYVLKPADWKPTDRRAAIVFFHGGGFVGGTPSQFNEQCRHLAGRGMVCIQAQYRLLAKDSSDPPLVCIHDARSAMRWVRKRAGELGVDPARIASGGGSAGGYLAAYVGMIGGLDDPTDDKSISPKSNAMILFNPVLDIGPNKWGYARVGERYKEFSPAHNISKDDPPAIVFLGSQDRLVPVQSLKDFQAEMRKAGVRCEVRIYEGQVHGFFNYRGADGGEYFRKTLDEADAFLVSLAWLSPKAAGGPATQPSQQK